MYFCSLKKQIQDINIQLVQKHDTINIFRVQHQQIQ